MKILFLSKDPRKCAELHNDEEVIAKIPQYTRFLSKSMNIRNTHVFIKDVLITKKDILSKDINWLLVHHSHRSYMFNLIRHLIKEYDKRYKKGFKFVFERNLLKEIGFWSDMGNIDWNGTQLQNK